MSDLGYVYFMRMEADAPPYDANPYTKIGYARDPEARRGVLKTGLPFEIEIDAVFPATQAEERSLHRKFSAQRIRGEWFKTNGPLDTFVGRIVDASLAIRMERKIPGYEPTLKECIAYKKPGEHLRQLISDMAARGEAFEVSPSMKVRFVDFPSPNE